MDRHLLVAIRDFSHAISGCMFASQFFADKSAIKLTLLTVATATAHPIKRGLAERKGLSMLKKVKKSLITSGFIPDNISLRTIQPMDTNALSILYEGSKGRFDAVIFSHEDRTGLDDLLQDSMCESVLKSSKEIAPPPLWLCRRPNTERRHVLLCTDGSGPSLRIADHTGFMLLRAPEQNVCVLHVRSSNEEHAEAEKIIRKTVRAIREAGLPKDRITYKIIEGRGVARTILQEVEENRFGVVAMGTAGKDRGFWDQLFIGSVARKVFENLEGTVLWASL